MADLRSANPMGSYICPTRKAAIAEPARAAVRKGAVIVEHCAARLVDVEGGRVAGVITEQGRIRAPEVVVAGGAWSSLLLRQQKRR